MTKEQKNQAIEELVGVLEGTNIVYLADIAGLDAESTGNLRRMCAKQGIQLSVVKNTLLKKAMERSSKNFDELYDQLHGNTSILIAEQGNAPARQRKCRPLRFHSQLHRGGR
jgi:large subunit ribosomal protein L10